MNVRTLAETDSGQRVGRFRGWARDFKKDAKGNVSVVLGVFPDDKHSALQFTDQLDGQVLIIEAYLIAPTPKEDMRDIDRLRAKMGHNPGMSIVTDDVIDLTEGRVFSNRRIVPWVFVMSRTGPHEYD